MRKHPVARIRGGLLLGSLALGCNGDGPTSSHGDSSSSGGSVSTSASTTADTTTGGSTAVIPTTTAATTTATTTDETTSGGPVLFDKRVFVTAASFHGDLKQQGGGADGVDGADRLCAAAAAQSSLGGVWVAWVSSSVLDAISRLPDDSRWTLLDGVTEVFPSRSQIQFGPKHAIDMTEAGESLLPPGPETPTVWTNTDSFGSNSTDGQNNACDDWTAQTGVAAVGVLFDPELGGGVGLSWTDTKQPRGCGGQYHLYCFER